MEQVGRKRVEALKGSGINWEGVGRIGSGKVLNTGLETFGGGLWVGELLSEGSCT